ncbi:GtrA family protein [Stenotrophomonas sp. PD6]|uniref:GtrA family protein n=1 Tax=Stenotrophomonas sp. PD6 TaxID=3368612 RepID=UPI003B9E85A9
MNSRVLRFLISGGSAAATEYLVFIALQELPGQDSLVLSQSVSFAAGFAVSFLLNRLWVFQSAGSWSGDLAKYGALAAINLVLGNLALGLLVGPAGLHPLLAKLVVMVMVAVWNYAVFSKVIFRQRPAA